MAKKNSGLSTFEEKWARNYVKGIAKMLALGPPGEPPEVTKEQIREIEQIALQPGSEVYKLAKKWRKRLLEALAPTEAG